MNKERENALGKIENQIKEEVSDSKCDLKVNGATKPIFKKSPNKNPPKSDSTEINTQNPNIDKSNYFNK